MIFAYADPPYLGCGKSHYGEHHPDAADWDNPATHRRLVERLFVDYPDGWALSCNPRDLLMYLRFCAAEDCPECFIPRRPDHVYCSPRCVKRLAARRRRAANPGAEKEYQDAYYQECRRYVLNQRRAAYWSDPEAQRERKRQARRRTAA